MKTLSFLALVCLLTVYGCKKSDPSSTLTSPSIIGKWSHTETIFNEIVNGHATPITDTKYSDPNIFIQFNKDGTGVDSEGSNGGPSYTLTYFTYTFADSLLTLDENNNFQPQVVKTFNQTSLHTHYEFSVTNGGIVYTGIFDYYYTKKQ